MVTINVAGIDIEIHRKKMKNMTLRVCAPQGIVKISAPLRSSQISIQRFAASHIEWIKNQQAVYLNKPAPQFDRQLFISQLEHLIPHWEQKIGVSLDRYCIRLMRSRWGSCTPHKRKICLNLALVNYPLVCLEYVIVHELVHFFEPSHNARFKAFMDKFMPEWREYKAILDGKMNNQEGAFNLLQ